MSGTTITIRSDWIALAGPAVAGLSGTMQNAGSILTGSGTAGAMVTGDCRSLIVWSGGQAQAWQVGTRAWSPVVSLPAGALVRGWAPVYSNRAVMYDSNSLRFYLIDFSGANVPVALSANNYTAQLQALPGHNGTTYVLSTTAPPLLVDPLLPGRVGITMRDTFGNSIVLLIDYRSATPLVQSAVKVTDGQLYAYIVGNGCWAETTSGAGDTGSILPGRFLKRPGLGKNGDPTAPYAQLGPDTGAAAGLFPISRQHPSSVPLPWLDWTTPETKVAVPQFDITGSGTIFATPPLPFAAFVGSLMASAPYVQSGRRSYVQGAPSGLALSAVTYVGFDLIAGSFGLPITVAAPSPLDNSSWLLANLDDVPYILDKALRFYVLDLVQYATVLRMVNNWTRKP
jgi:hypothetical protein